jgi:hypothetical protein
MPSTPPQNFPAQGNIIRPQASASLPHPRFHILPTLSAIPEGTMRASPHLQTTAANAQTTKNPAEPADSLFPHLCMTLTLTPLRSFRFTIEIFTHSMKKKK